MRKPDLDPTALELLLRQVFGASVPVRWQRTPDGVSTQVYRLVRGSETFYLRVLDAIQTMIDQERSRPPERAFLAHGDFDVTHVFCHRGRYSGLIDFGEIRGAELTFDLGHFMLQDDGSHAPPLLPILVEGYRQVVSLPPDHEPAIRRSAVLLGLRQLCRWLGPARGHGLAHPAVVERAQRLGRLVTGGC